MPHPRSQLAPKRSTEGCRNTAPALVTPADLGSRGGSEKLSRSTAVRDNQLIEEEVAGSIAGRSLEFVIHQRAASPWNTLVGGQIEFGKHLNVLVEGGCGDRSSIVAGAAFRF